MAETSIPLTRNTRDLLKKVGSKEESWDQLLMRMYKALGGNKDAVIRTLSRYS